MGELPDIFANILSKVAGGKVWNKETNEEEFKLLFPELANKNTLALMLKMYKKFWLLWNKLLKMKDMNFVYIPIRPHEKNQSAYHPYGHNQDDVKYYLQFAMWDEKNIMQECKDF